MSELVARRRDLVRVVIAAADLRRRPRNFGTIASKPPCVRWLGLSAHRYLYRTAAFLGEFRIERDGFGVGAIVFVNGHKSAAPPPEGSTEQCSEFTWGILALYCTARAGSACMCEIRPSDLACNCWKPSFRSCSLSIYLPCSDSRRAPRRQFHVASNIRQQSRQAIAPPPTTPPASI